jgi:hypothetical protein
MTLEHGMLLLSKWNGAQVTNVVQHGRRREVENNYSPSRLASKENYDGNYNWSICFA